MKKMCFVHLNNILFILLTFNLMSVKVTKCEDTVFRIRKCCAENELILERTGQCSEYKLLKVSNHVYHMNETNGDGDKTTDYGFKSSRPWWFPPKTEILSKQGNISLREFPKDYQLIAGQGQPCKESETSFLPAYFYKYSFYDDGSILIYMNKDDKYHPLKTTTVFDPLSFCIDRLDLDVDAEEEVMEPILDISETVDYMVMLCPCTKATCILKCCQPGMLFDMRNEDDKNSCIRNNGDDWTPVYSKTGGNGNDYFLLHGMPECKPGESVVLPNYKNGNNPGYIIFSNGSARVEDETYVSQYMEFCGESIIDSKNKKVQNHILRCYPRYGINGTWAEVKRILYGWLSVVGAVFLFLTLLVHSSLSSLKKLNDKSLIYQTWSLFIGYVCVAVTQLAASRIHQGVCTFLAFLIQYSFLSAFFWLNVLCFDISYTFSSLRIARCSYLQANPKKHIYYYSYGWLAPAVIVLVTIIIEFHPGISDTILKPKIKERCWFQKGSLAQLAYFYGPIAILLAINFFLFIYTSFKIMQARNEISTTIRSRNLENQRFLLYLKLFILMGLSWITELISWAIGGPEYYWFIPDIVNLLRAMFIFVIICCKKQVVEELKKKFRIQKETNVRRPSNTRSSNILPTTNLGESFKYPNHADSSL